MKKPIKAEVVNAFVTSLRDLFLASTGIEGELAPLKLASDVPPPPNLTVSIQVTGKLNGPAIYSFEPGVARAIAGNMLHADPAPEADSPECRDALGELANILVGNATGALIEEGYPVQLSPPTIEQQIPPPKLEQRSVTVSLNTKMGQVSLLLSLTQA